MSFLAFTSACFFRQSRARWPYFPQWLQVPSNLSLLGGPPPPEPKGLLSGFEELVPGWPESWGLYGGRAPPSFPLDFFFPNGGFPEPLLFGSPSVEAGVPSPLDPFFRLPSGWSETDVDAVVCWMF